MRPLSLFALLVVLLAAAPLPAAMPPAVGDTPLPTLAPMIKKVSPAVVNIATRGTIRERGPQNPLLDDPFFRRFFDVPPDTGPRERPFQSAGSGVIFDAKSGYIVTNAHVVENASEITVTLQDGRDLKAEVVGSDTPSDVAVLQGQARRASSQIPLGDSAKVEVGDFVVAIGNPFGLQHTVTSGIISGLSRSGINPDGYEDFIQTDASINPGNSGGALVNLRGELIGINTAILSRSGGNIGIGFAIPVNMARSVMEQLIKYGSVKRGQLGVSMYTVTPDIAHSLGLPQRRGRAGVAGGRGLAGRPGRHPHRRRHHLRERPAGQVQQRAAQHHRPAARRRQGRHRAGARRQAAEGHRRDRRHHRRRRRRTGEASTRACEGATLVDAPDDGGALVRSVEPGSAAAQAGLRADDVIVGANRGRVTSLRELRERAKGAAVLVLEVKRGNTILLVPLR